MFPTAGKMAGALAFAALGFMLARAVTALLPPGTQIGWFWQFAALIGAWFGWRIAGREAGSGFGAALSSGLLTTIYMLAAGLAGFSFAEMISRALRNRYHGLGAGLEGWVDLVKDYAPLLIRQEVVVTALVGTLLAALVTELVGRRFS